MGYLFKAILGAALFDGETVLGDRDERPAAAPSSGLGGFGWRTTSMSEMMRGAQSTLGPFGSPTDEEFQREKAKVLSGM